MTAPVLSTNTPWGRYYIHPRRVGAQVPSVTNIKNVKGIDALKFWAAREAAIYAADNHDKLTPLDREERIRLVKGAPFARTSSSAAAAAAGDVVHDWIDRTIKGEEIRDYELAHPTVTDRDGNPVEVSAVAARSAQGMWEQFHAIQHKYRPKWERSEFTCWSDTYGYAGTADASARIGDWLTLIDHKTGKGVHEDVAMQLAALAKCDFILGPDGVEEAMPSFEKFAVLHLRPRGAKLIPVLNIDKAFKQFLGLKEYFDIDIECKDQFLGAAPTIKAA